MTAYQNCRVGETISVTIHSGNAEAGYASASSARKNRPLVTLSFETRGDAEQARAEVARAVEKAVEVTPQG